MTDEACDQVVARGHEDKLVLLPLQIKHVRLEGIGPFRFFEAQFRRDQLNVLFGLGGAGKSVVLRSIALCFGIPNCNFLTFTFRWARQVRLI
jgi:hypothetical protein